MASSRPRKSAKKDGKTALQEAIDECKKLLEKTKKPRKKTRFRISRDPLTGRRKSRYPYKPRFQDDAQSISGPHHEPDDSDNFDSEGVDEDVGEERYIASSSSVHEEIEKDVADHRKLKVIERDAISKLSKQQARKIIALQEKHDAVVTIEEEIGRISIRGDAEDVLWVGNTIHKILDQQMEEEHTRGVEELVSKNTQWFYYGDDNSLEPYDISVNLQIENAFGDGQNSVIVLIDEVKCKIVFNDMKETCLEDGEVRVVIRKEIGKANQPSETRLSLQRQLREMEEQLRNVQGQLREKELREVNFRGQLREKDQQQENAQRQLREKEQQLENFQGELRGKELQEANLHEQLMEKDQQQENTQRQQRELEQQLTNLQERCRGKEEETVNLLQQVTTLEGQLRAKDQEVNELEITLSTAQLALNNQQQQRQQSPDWVIPGDQIQLTDKCLGRGGWGSVFKGKYCGCAVAVKQIHELILSPHNRSLFEREMDIASRCRHPCLLQFIGATNDEGSPLFVTELMETSLRALLEQRPLSATEVSIISLDVARALNYLHQKKPSPIIHRDISSANVLLWRQGDQWRGKVSDYGTANFMQQTMTVAPGAMIYSAPDALTSRNQTVKIDVYSFGVLLCEMCIRELPDPGRRDQQVAMVTNRLIRALIRGCLQPEPETRPSMEEIVEELEEPA
ncbi:hypothetical protein OS493_038561 [Desmophyllum pertusum]|uniref:Uncharacterized protein n=1 Tax=Desmophyllum pertusum TaxID=174260 RepID=A0A9W9ZJ09_9CNID|nr:hypothetical protein OS493_038561 [Desmophyllum pertusum]